MNQKKSLKERLDEQLANWKQNMEELAVQLNLGKKEAGDEFKRQKSNLMDWLERKQPLLDNVKEEVSGDVAALKTKIGELLDRLKKEESGGEEVKEEELAASIDELQDEAEELEDKSSGKTQRMAEDFGDQLNVYRTRLSGLAAAVRDEAKEEWAELKEDSAKAVEILRKKTSEISEEAKEEWDELKSDARALFKRLRDRMEKGKEENDEGE